jgi:hypothetical protein
MESVREKLRVKKREEERDYLRKMETQTEWTPP